MMTEPVLGIDFGTEYSCCGILLENHVKMIPNNQSKNKSPNFISFTKDKQRLFGDSAKADTVNFKNMIFHAKKFIGKKMDDIRLQFNKDIYPFELIGDKAGRVMIKIENDQFGTNSFYPEEIAAMFLRKQKENAEQKLGKEVSKCVIAVPSYFNQRERLAVKSAAEIAGFKEARLLNESSAVALTFASDNKNHGRKKNVLIYDLGAGFFEASVVQVNNGSVEVKGRSGCELGGVDLTHRMVTDIVNPNKYYCEVDLQRNKKAIQRISNELERLKVILSQLHSTRIELDSLSIDQPEFTLREGLTREWFESINEDLFNKTLVHVSNSLKMANLLRTDIEEVVLMGGSTRIPKVQSLLSDYFNGKTLNKTINTDEAVANGAAIVFGTGVCLHEIVPAEFNLKLFDSTLEFTVPKTDKIPFSYSFYLNKDKLKKLPDNFVLFSLSENDVEYENVIESSLKLQDKSKLCFRINEDGIYSVEFTDIAKYTSKYLDTTLVKELKIFADSCDKIDSDQQKWVEAKNELEEKLFRMRSKLNSAALAAKLSGEDKAPLLAKIDENLSWLQTIDSITTTCDGIKLKGAELDMDIETVLKRPNEIDSKPVQDQVQPMDIPYQPYPQEKGKLSSCKNKPALTESARLQHIYDFISIHEKEAINLIDKHFGYLDYSEKINAKKQIKESCKNMLEHFLNKEKEKVGLEVFKEIVIASLNKIFDKNNLPFIFKNNA